MKVISLFDGISCARVALERVGIKVDAYYASEIDKYVMQISQKNYPEIIQLGSVTDIDVSEFDGCGWETCTCWNQEEHLERNLPFDLLIGGSPCQDLSIAKKERKGLDGDRSSLFWEYVRILKEVRPKYFIFENVNSMPKEAKALITETLGVEPIMIDAGIVSAQQRKRLFWTNIPGVTLPKDKGIFAWDIIEMGSKEVFQYRRTYWREIKSGKIPTLTANMGTGGRNVPYVVVKEATKKGYTIAFPGQTVDTAFPNSKTRRGRVGNKVENLMTANTIHVFDGKDLRPLTPEECEKCQGLPRGYTDGFPKTHRLKAIGNAFNVDVVAHILSFITPSPAIKEINN